MHNLRVSFIMSRVGKLPISIPGSVKFQVDGSDINLTGPKGSLSLQVRNIVVNMSGNQVTIMPSDESSVSRAMWGLFRSLLFNAVKGVSEGWTRRLEINGVGYRAAASEGFLVLSLGYSHEVIYAIPPSIEIKCEKPTLLLISGCDKQLVGQVAAEIRQLRKPEPYKGKGIKYDDEVIRRKEGKKK